jgi:DNA-directed RNA polymerase specialized sigma subunit
MSQTSIAEELGITSQPYVGRRLKHIRKVLQQALMSE